MQNEQQRPYWKVAVSLVFSLIATAAVIIIGIKSIGFFMPFVIGWLISAIAAPMVNWLERKLNIVKKLGTALIVILVIAAIVLGGYFLLSRLVKELQGFIADFPALYRQVLQGIEKAGESLSVFYDKLPESVQNGWNTFLANLDVYMGELVSKISEPTVTAAGNIVKSIPSLLVSIIMAILSAYFFTVDRKEIIRWLKEVAPKSLSKRMTLVMDNLRYAVGGYFKAQFKIMVVVFGILLIGFGMMKVPYYALVAVLVAFLDFLPVFGTGTALWPWALYELLTGKYRTVIILLVIYAITQLVHHLLQPKMVGDSIGMNPIIALFLLYIGYHVSSFLGMILSVPIGLVVINMYKAGAFDYLIDDAAILVNGILSLRGSDKE